MKIKPMIGVCIMLAAAASLPAMDFGVSAGTWSAPRSNEFLDEGTHASLGGVLGLSPRWELELFTLAQLTPDPFGELLGGASLSYALAGPVHGELQEVPSYLNAYVGLGFVSGITGSDSWGPFVRITPVSLGGPRFMVRERAAAVGGFYNVPEKSFTLFWNVFLLDFFL